MYMYIYIYLYLYSNVYTHVSVPVVLVHVLGPTVSVALLYKFFNFQGSSPFQKFVICLV